ncbi:unnamed protein product [Bursaphelenchus xylophilus]|uniref:(pine wood nematode) hypothetical protein n=1 Tax=Bursaphelenchus xylophilus TaxID=6326 RepID=A0A1I7SQR5_BURXY|nr:unnamed protein product [Bursaphelenchus xylophilus]CAG9110280.1 unnamed protein product [Bursaphelenchus xylophilus]
MTSLGSIVRRLKGKVEESKYSSYIRLIPYLTVALLAHLYVTLAFIHDVDRAIFPLVILILAYLIIFYKIFAVPFLQQKHVKEKIKNARRTVFGLIQKIPFLEYIVGGVVLAGFFTWLIIDCAGNYTRFRSLGGVLVFIIICILCSSNPGKIKWRPVFGGIILQFTVGLLVLRWETGNQALQTVSTEIVRFLHYTFVGTLQTYGFIVKMPDICGMAMAFVFTSLQIIIYFGAVVSVLYYYGIIQVVLSKVAWVMQHTIGTTAAESLNAAACIFLGQTEAAILIEPALLTMTDSEIHTVMTAGFACIAGSLFSAYIEFGACPTHILSATVMSASASLAISKIIYPEVQKSKQKESKTFKFAAREANNLLECISNGAVHSAQFIGAIAANLVVYTALLYLINSIMGWIGECVDIQDLSLNKLLGYAFFPLAYAMGTSDAEDPDVAIKETLKVAELMGVKTVLNEFIAYQKLSEMVKTGELVGERARMIATYALCGFSNISMIGSQIGILTSMCPERKHSFSKVAVRALIAGIFSCFTTACVAGILVSTPKACTSTTDHGKCLDMYQLEDYYQRYINGTH